MSSEAETTPSTDPPTTPADPNPPVPPQPAPAENTDIKFNMRDAINLVLVIGLGILLWIILGMLLVPIVLLTRKSLLRETNTIITPLSKSQRAYTTRTITGQF